MSKQGKFYTYTLAYESGIVFYVGKGKDGRVSHHESEARRVPLVNSRKCNTIRKIWASGEQVVKTILSYFESEQEAFQYEIALIFLMRGTGNLTNLTDGGEGMSGLEFSEVTRQKVRAAMMGNQHSKGYVHSETHHQKLIAANKGKHSKGHVHSETTRQKMSDTHKGHVHSETTRQKMSLASKGHPVSDAQRQKLRAAMMGKRNTGERVEQSGSQVTLWNVQ